MYIVIIMVVAFFFVILLVLQGPDEEIINEVEKIKAQTEPEVEHKSALDPFTAENTKPKRKYKQRKSSSKIRGEEVRE